MKKRLSIIFPTSVTIVCLPICTHCFPFPRSNIYSSEEYLLVRFSFWLGKRTTVAIKGIWSDY